MMPKIQTFPFLGPEDDPDLSAAAPAGSRTQIPAVRANQVPMPESDHPAVFSAKTEDEAKQALIGQAETAVNKPLSLLTDQHRDITRSLRNAARLLRSMPRTRPALPGSNSLRWPTTKLDRLQVCFFLLAGIALTALGWWNSAHLALTFLQQVAWSYGFTAVLLLLPLATHLLTRDLGEVSQRFLTFLLGVTALCGAALLIKEIGGGSSRGVGDLFDSVGPNRLHLLVGQVLVEISTGTLFFQAAEKRLRCAIETVPNPEYQDQFGLVVSLESQRALVQAEIKALEAKAKDWVQRHLLRWKARNA
jgi:hypothetical protein